MEEKLCLFAIQQTATSLQRTCNLNPRTKLYPVLDESNWMKSIYFTINPGKNPPLQNGLPVEIRFLFQKKAPVFTSSTFPIQSGFSQSQPAAITLNIGSLPDIGLPYAFGGS